MENKIVARAKKNFHDYKIISKIVAGIVLTGNEIKSLRNNQVSINEAYVLPQQKELYIINMYIALYKHSYAGDLAKNYGSTRRKRKLLLKRKEINRLISASKAKNYSLIPLRLFINNRGWAKLEIATAQRLRKYQIKEKIKEREEKKKLQKGDLW